MIKIKKAGRPSSVDQWVSSCLFAHVCSQQRLQLGLSHTFHSLSYDYSSLNWVKTHFEFFYVGYGGNNWIFILGWFGVWQITGKSFNSISGKYLGPVLTKQSKKQLCTTTEKWLFQNKRLDHGSVRYIGL